MLRRPVTTGGETGRTYAGWSRRSARSPSSSTYRLALNSAGAGTAACARARLGRADDLAGRYLHAEHVGIEELIGRAEERRDDLNFHPVPPIEVFA